MARNYCDLPGDGWLVSSYPETQMIPTGFKKVALNRHEQRSLCAPMIIPIYLSAIEVSHQRWHGAIGMSANKNGRPRLSKAKDRSSSCSGCISDRQKKRGVSREFNKRFTKSQNAFESNLAYENRFGTGTRLVSCMSVA